MTVPSSIWPPPWGRCRGNFLGRQQRTAFSAVSTGPFQPRQGVEGRRQRGRDGLRDDIRAMEDRRKTVAQRPRGWTMWTTSQQPRFANTA